MIKKQILSIKNAICGVHWVVVTQRNFKIQLFLSFLAIIGGIIFQLSYQEFLVILILIFVGLAIEAINTAIEETIDASNKEQNEQIRIAKDVAAASMLIFSVGALIIALIIFTPKIFQYIISLL